ncbi:ABC transporter substrate-binding protein [bacterium]|nr:ABC transporter substrate-binding protein [bacterium]
MNFTNKLLPAFFLITTMLSCGQEKTSNQTQTIDLTKPKEGGILIYGRGGDSVGLDPAKETDGETMKICDNIYENLVDYDENTAQIIPCLATSWEISENGLDYVFTLRQNVKFHDGTDFNADAVLFNFNRAFDKNNPFYNIGGTNKYWDNMGMSQIIKEISKIDSFTVKFVLHKPEAPFLANLGMNFTAISSPAAIQKFGEDYGKNPVGTGPFKFAEWVKDSRIVLEANLNHWEKRPYLDKVIFRTIPENNVRFLELKKGSIDIMDLPSPDDIPLMEKDENLKVLKAPGLNVGYLAINCEHKPFDNPKVRRAINHAINKQAIVDNFYGGLGVVAKNPLPPTLWGYDDSVVDYDFNPEKAKTLLKEANVKNLKISLYAMPVPRPYMPDGVRVAQAIQSDLQNVGIEAEIVQREWGTYLEETDHGKHDLALLGWSGDNGDPDNFVYILLDKTATQIPAQNIAFYKSDELHEVLLKAKTSNNQKERGELYKQACKIIKKDAPWVPIAHSLVVQPMKKDVIGYKIHPLDKKHLKNVWLAREKKIGN